MVLYVSAPGAWCMAVDSLPLVVQTCCICMKPELHVMRRSEPIRLAYSIWWEWHLRVAFVSEQH